jgi:hypothetical protein
MNIPFTVTVSFEPEDITANLEAQFTLGELDRIELDPHGLTAAQVARVQGEIDAGAFDDQAFAEYHDNQDVLDWEDTAKQFQAV